VSPMCPVQTVTHVSGRSPITNFAPLKEGRHLSPHRIALIALEISS